jgi:TP901 family phage tail tape measure protein
MADALSELFGKIVVDVDDKKVKRATEGIQRFTQGFRNMMGVIGGAVAARAVGNWIRQTIDLGDELDKTSQQIGLTVQQLESLRFSANLAGIESGEFANALGQLQRRADDAAHGGSESAEAFQRLGIDLNNAQGELRSADDLLLSVADSMQNLDNSSERTALAMQLMGRQGRRMLPMLINGSEAIREQRAEFERLVGGSLTEFVEVSRDAQDDLTRFNVVMMSTRARLAVQILPLFSRAVIGLSRLSQMFRELTEDTNLLKAGLIVLIPVLGRFAIRMAIANAPLVLAAAAIGLLILVIDDLLTAIEGGDSVIGKWINEWLHANGVTATFQELAEKLGDNIQAIWRLFQEEGPRAAAQRLAELLGVGQQFETLILSLTVQWEILMNMLRVPGYLVRGITEITNAIRSLVSAVQSAIAAAMRFLGILQLLEPMVSRMRGASQAIGGMAGVAARGAARTAGGGALAAGRTGIGARIGRFARTVGERTVGQTLTNIAGSTFNLSIQTAATDPAEVGRIARREVQQAQEQDRRRTLAAIERRGP